MNAVERLAFRKNKGGPLHGHHSVEEKKIPLHSFYIINYVSFRLFEVTTKNFIILVFKHLCLKKVTAAF